MQVQAPPNKEPPDMVELQGTPFLGSPYLRSCLHPGLEFRTYLISNDDHTESLDVFNIKFYKNVKRPFWG